MRVDVDLEACDQHGQCVLAAPTVFRFDDEGALAFEPIIEDVDLESVEEAALLCPVQAITLS